MKTPSFTCARSTLSRPARLRRCRSSFGPDRHQLGALHHHHPRAKYILNGNLNSASTTAPAITVSAPNVIIDLNGYYVSGPDNPAAAFSTANSVILVSDVATVTVKNGTVAGNATGIYFAATTAANSRNYIVDGVTITHCYQYGIRFDNPSGGNGAPGSIIRGCTFSLLGGSTASGVTSVYAIYTYDNVRIENNAISGVTAPSGGSSYGIDADDGCFEIGNTISGCTLRASSSAPYLNNLTSGCMTPFSDGTAATGNSPTP